jgi:hypothetical protein
MRLCVVPLINDFSGDLWAKGMGLTVYELAGAAALSRAFSSSALAACMMRADVFGRNVRFGEPGFKGSGGGARSGSELSHLKSHVSLCLDAYLHWEASRWETYIGMLEKECVWRTSSRSRESSLSVDGIVWCERCRW